MAVSIAVSVPTARRPDGCHESVTVRYEQTNPTPDEPPTQPQAYRAVRLSLTPEGPGFLVDRLESEFREELPTRRLRPVQLER